jgi:hypothetical protein
MLVGGSPYMCAVLIWTQERGRFRASPIARPISRVESTRDRKMSSRFSGVFTQSTLRPMRLTTAAAPSTTPAHD